MSLVSSQEAYSLKASVYPDFLSSSSEIGLQKVKRGLPGRERREFQCEVSQRFRDSQRNSSESTAIHWPNQVAKVRMQTEDGKSQVSEARPHGEEDECADDNYAALRQPFSFALGSWILVCCMVASCCVAARCCERHAAGTMRVMIVRGDCHGQGLICASKDTLSMTSICSPHLQFVRRDASCSLADTGIELFGCHVGPLESCVFRA